MKVSIGSNRNVYRATHEELGTSSPPFCTGDNKVVRFAKRLRKRKLSKQSRDNSVLNYSVDFPPEEIFSGIYENQALIFDETKVLLSRFKSRFSDVISKFGGNTELEVIGKRVETLILLFCSLKRAQDLSHAAVITTAVLSSCFDRSITSIALEMISKLCDVKTYSNQGLGAPSSSRPTWLTLLKQAQTDWQLVLENEGFKNFGMVISILITLGMCDASSVNYTIKGVKLFSFHALKKQCSAVDLVDAIFTTVIYFIEGGYECFNQGSLNPLLYGDFNARELEERLIKCQEFALLAKSGNSEQSSGMCIADISNYYQDTIELLTRMKATAPNTVAKKILADKMVILRRNLLEFDSHTSGGGLREAPYTMCFYGGTGVGKSSVSNLLMYNVLLANNFSADKNRICNINFRDKFFSGYKSNILGVLMDDFGNTNANFVQFAPTDTIIDIVNNVEQYATAAEAEMKGKIKIQPKVACITTNVKSLSAEIYSNEPASITRRCNYICTVKVREEFMKDGGMLDPGKVAFHFSQDEDVSKVIRDLWEFTVEETFPVPNPTPGRPDIIGWNTVLWAHPEGHYIYMKDIDIYTLIDFSIHQSQIHFAQQKDLVERSNNLVAHLDFCACCNRCKQMCKCRKHVSREKAASLPSSPKLTEQVCDGILSVINPFLSSPEEESEEESSETDSQSASSEYENQGIASHVAGSLFHLNFIQPVIKAYDKALCGRSPVQTLEEFTSRAIMARLEDLEYGWMFKWTSYVPESMMDTAFIRNEIMRQCSSEYEKSLRHKYLHLRIGSFVIFFLMYYFSRYFFFLQFGILYLWAVMARVEKQKLYTRIQRERNLVPECVTYIRDSYGKRLLDASIAIMGIYFFISALRLGKFVSVEDQGNINPTCMKDIVKRDEEGEAEKQLAKDYNWSTHIVSPLPVGDKGKTTTPDQLQAMVLSNLAFFDAEYDGKHAACNIVFIKSNLALLPGHIIDAIPDNCHATIIKRDKKAAGLSFRALICKAHIVRIEDTDLALVYVPNGGSWKDISPYLPTGLLRTAPARFTYKKLNADMTITNIKERTNFAPHLVSNQTGRFVGGKYDLPFETFPGLCMGVLTSDSSYNTILGFHLGGISGEVHAICGTLTYAQLTDAVATLQAKPSVLVTTSEGTLRDTVYDVQYITSDKIHDKSPLHKIPDDANCEVYGSCIGGAKYFSQVRDSCISQDVEEVCGIENNYGKPAFHLGQAWTVSLNHSTTPSLGMSADLLDRAVNDYTAELIIKIDSIPDVKKLMRPLSRMETVNGIDGVRFIDRMPPNTSVGAPLSGPKSQFLTPLDPKDYPDWQDPFELDCAFWEEFGFCQAEFLAGRRVYFTFKACLKDEPTPKTKTKVRVFQAAPIVLQLFTRMYFLPIVRLLSLFPTVSECAVGINMIGPEYHQLLEFMITHGLDRILAGDYSKYDLRMAAQLVLAAFSILIKIAEHVGYSHADLTIMRAVATEIAYPLIMYNGDLIEHHGSNPSGQNLTVYVNSIVNSLLMRCCFFQLYPMKKRFRDFVAMITYGDDVAGSVSEKCSKFNHIAYAQFLDKHDMKFTMPDKTSTPKPYMHFEEVDFLKRKPVWNEELQLWTGALSEDSIFKSLHSNVVKTASPTEVAVSCIDGALREWFLHGEEKYEMRRAQMNEVAKRAALDGHCKLLSRHYVSMMEEHKEKYDLNPSREDVKLVPPSAGTC